MKATLKTELVVSSDSDQRNVLWKETDDALNTIIRTDVDVYSAGVVKLAANGPLYTVPIGDIGAGDGKILFLSSDAEVSVRLNGSADPVVVSPSGSYRGMLVLHGEFTSLTVTPGAAAANVRYCLVGVE